MRSIVVGARGTLSGAGSVMVTEFFGLSGYFQRAGMRRLRRNTRVWRDRMASDDPYLHMRMSNFLDVAPLGIAASRLGNVLPGVSGDTVALHLRQSFLVRYLNSSILPALMHVANGTPDERPVIALPPAWVHRLREDGVNVRPVLSRMLWHLSVFRAVAAGAVNAWRFALNQRSAPPPPDGRFSTLFLTDISQLPCRDDSYDLVTTFRRTGLGAGPDERVWAVVPHMKTHALGDAVSVSDRLFPGLGAGSLWQAFALESLGMIAADMARVATGQWWRAFLISERVQAAYVARLPADRLARFYGFTSYQIQIRPLWTYIAEQRDAVAGLLFASTNFEMFSQNSAHHWPVHTGLASMSWQVYGIWDTRQAEFLDSIGYAGAEKVAIGPIGFNETPLDLPEWPTPSVAVFDIFPKKYTFLARTAYPCPYYSKYMDRFVADIVDVAEELGVTLIFKHKRDLGPAVQERYKRRLRNLKNKPNVVILDSGISAHRVIRESDMLVSAPFTSTALIGKAFGKPSLYYDPSGGLKDQTGLSRQLPIAASREELKKWLSVQLSV